MPDDEYIDPFAAHFRREPLTDAGVRVIVLSASEPGGTEDVGRSLHDLLRARGRDAEVATVDPAVGGMAAALDAGRDGASFPIVLVADGESPWTDAHLDPLLDAIDQCDHVVGRRRAGWVGSAGRWFAGVVWRWVFAVPVADVHSPYRLHRLDKLAAMPLQSASAFVNVELLAKATFLGHLIDEVDVPETDRPRARPRVNWGDVARVFRRPTFVRRLPSGPSEDPQRQDERDDGPGGENGERRGDGEPPRPFEDDRAEGVEQLRQGEGLDDRLRRVGEPIGGEKDARE